MTKGKALPPDDHCVYTDEVCKRPTCDDCELYHFNMVYFDGTNVRNDGIEISRGNVCARHKNMPLLLNTFYDRQSKVPRQYIDITLDNPIIDEMYPVYRWLVEQYGLDEPRTLMMAFKQPLLAQHGDMWYMVAPRYET